MVKPMNHRQYDDLTFGIRLHDTLEGLVYRLTRYANERPNRHDLQGQSMLEASRVIQNAMNFLTPEQKHHDDLAVDAFAKAMRTRLKARREDGRSGWDDPDQVSGDQLSKMLRDCVEKGDTVDVANFACFLYNRCEAITKGTESNDG